MLSSNSQSPGTFSTSFGSLLCFLHHIGCIGADRRKAAGRQSQQVAAEESGASSCQKGQMFSSGAEVIRRRVSAGFTFVAVTARLQTNHSVLLCFDGCVNTQAFANLFHNLIFHSSV